MVTGFIAKDEKGTVTTLGRGGSDLSASLIGAAIDADEIWFWKETSGIMTTDPKIEPEAKSIPAISYLEAMELSNFGAKVLHPRAIEPAIRKGIPVRVKCTFDPDIPGTQIVHDDVPKADVIKAVTLHKNVALLNISGAGMIGTLGVAARAFTALARAGINIVMQLVSGSIDSIDFFAGISEHTEGFRAGTDEFFAHSRVLGPLTGENVCFHLLRFTLGHKYNFFPSEAEALRNSKPIIKQFINPRFSF